MTSSRQHWLQSPNATWLWTIGAAAVWAAILSAISFSPVADYLDTRVTRAFDFKIRDAVGFSPELSPKLKIFSIDDKTLTNGLESWVMNADEWANVLEAMAARNPKAIYIDAIFAKVPGAKAGAAALERIKSIKVPINSGAFIVENPISQRPTLRIDRDWYKASTYVPNGFDFNSEISNVPLLGSPGNWWHAYGPSPELSEAFSRNGHIIQRDGRVFPFVWLNESTVLPALGMFAAESVRFERGRLFVNENVVSMDDEGSLILNFSPKSTYMKRSVSMNWVLSQIRKDLPVDEINEGDHVLILPQMFTGNTDIRMTPLGYMPGGFVHAAFINSVLTANYLKIVNLNWLMIILACVFGALLGKVLQPRYFWAVMISGCAGCLILVSALFITSGVYIAWLLPFFGFWGSGIAVFVEKARIAERKSNSLRLALDGAVAPGELKNLIRNPELLRLEAREQVVTLMFIDVVGFSLFAENMLPRLAFDNLKIILLRLGEMVHEHGGVVDKTLGDGLLCYFGYSFDATKATSDHAEQAVRCGIAIQKDNLARNLEAALAGDPVYPLRIGINTASCFLGDLGSNERIDFTVVGNGVNFAKRLEGACEMHSVMYGSTTKDLITAMGLSTAATTRRLIRIKHHSELVEAYEFDPFFDKPEVRAASLEAFRKSANLERIDQRWPIHDPSIIQIKTNLGPAEMVNFSHTGFSLRTERLISKGAVLEMYMDAGGGRMRDKLVSHGLESLDGEVRWGYETDKGYVHGVMLRNLSKEQADFVVQCLLDFAFAIPTAKNQEDKSGEVAA